VAPSKFLRAQIEQKRRRKPTSLFLKGAGTSFFFSLILPVGQMVFCSVWIEIIKIQNSPPASVPSGS
jgi:hypothetical protein